MQDHFGPEISAYYDRDHGDHTPEEISQTVDFLSSLAGQGRILEFAIGTGRIALPLSGKGHQVSGIELSPSMVEHLQAKPGGNAIDVEIGDMAEVTVEGTFSLVFLVFNTLPNLTSQDAQLACFANAAAHLQTGGYFVIECNMPPVQQLPERARFLAFDRSEHHWGIDEIDTATQQGVSHHIWFDGETERRMSMPFRYVWPAEMDLMARMAGMKLTERWQDWNRTPFTGESRQHVSVWQKS